MIKCSKCGTVHPPKIEQCEGCSSPLESYLTAYEKGCLKVTWVLCSTHRSQASGSAYSNY